MTTYGPGDVRNSENIPPHLLSALKAYEATGRVTGKCLRSMLANDYYDAALIGADQAMLRAIPAIIFYIYNDMVGHCHGSYEVYEAWCKYAWFKSELTDIVSGEQDAELCRLAEVLSDARSLVHKLREGAYQ